MKKQLKYNNKQEVLKTLLIEAYKNTKKGYTSFYISCLERVCEFNGIDTKAIYNNTLI